MRPAIGLLVEPDDVDDPHVFDLGRDQVGGGAGSSARGRAASAPHGQATRRLARMRRMSAVSSSL